MSALDDLLEAIKRKDVDLKKLKEEELPDELKKIDPKERPGYLDKLEGERFRHGTRFIRFRPDKNPKQCTWSQLDVARRLGDPSLADLLAGSA